jgi:hypothetical protein
MSNNWPRLHIFELDGLWHWGLTVKRPSGMGEKVVAYSSDGYQLQLEAATEGRLALDSYTRGQVSPS